MRNSGRFAAIAVMLSLVIAMSAAAAAGAEKAPSLWSWREGHKPVWDAVMKAHPDLAMDFVAYLNVDYDAVLLTSFQAGSGPDIVTGKGAQLITLGNAGLLAPLEGLIPELRAFPEAALSQVSSGGHIYGVPIVYQTLQFFYNKSIFDKYGLSEPQTWDELLAAARKLKAAGIIPIAVSAKDAWTLGLILATAGASHLDQAWVKDLVAGRARFTDKPFVDLLTRINDLKQFFQPDYMAFGYGDMSQLFLNQKAAMRIDGAWSLPSIESNMPAGMKLGMFLAPPLERGKPSKAYLFLDGGLGLNVGARNDKRALDLLRFTTSLQFSQTWHDQLKEIPALPGVRVSSGPLYAELMEYAAHPISELFAVRSVFERGTPSISTLVNAGLQGMLAGKVTPQQLAAEIQQGIASWYVPGAK